MDDLKDKLNDAILGAIIDTLANDVDFIIWLTNALQAERGRSVGWGGVVARTTSGKGRGFWLYVGGDDVDVYTWYWVVNNPADVKSWLLSLK